MSDILDEDLEFLETLYTSARKNAEQTRREKTRSSTHEDAAKAAAALVRMKEKYLLPEYWELIGGVALVHAPSQTLLGNYSEFRHKTEQGCKKLVREHSPITITRTEYVHDDWYLGVQVREHIEPQTWTSTREATLDVQLPELGVGAPEVPLKIYLAWGGIMQVRLAEPTRFVSPGGEMFLHLTAGTNILEVMGLDSKLALRQEIMK